MSSNPKEFEALPDYKQCKDHTDVLQSVDPTAAARPSTSDESGHRTAADSKDKDLKEILYSDSYCVVTREHIKIFVYYFPLGIAKVVKLSSITSLDNAAELGYGNFCFKTWGMALTDVWWALSLDSGRMMGSVPERQIVIRTDTGTVGKGFSVSRPEEFMHVVRDVLHLPRSARTKAE